MNFIKPIWIQEFKKQRRKSLKIAYERFDPIRLKFISGISETISAIMKVKYKWYFDGTLFERPVSLEVNF
jgi:hypothetical protein